MIVKTEIKIFNHKNINNDSINEIKSLIELNKNSKNIIIENNKKYLIRYDIIIQSDEIKSKNGECYNFYIMDMKNNILQLTDNGFILDEIFGNSTNITDIKFDDFLEQSTSICEKYNIDYDPFDLIAGIMIYQISIMNLNVDNLYQEFNRIINYYNEIKEVFGEKLNM